MVKPYYIVYRMLDDEIDYFMYGDGAVVYKMNTRQRKYDVGVRVGSAEVDNTHHIRSSRSARRDLSRLTGLVPMGDNDIGIRQSLWGSTHLAYNKAVETYKNVVENLKTRAEEEDKARDFLPQSPQKIYVFEERIKVDEESMRKSAQKCSALFKNNPQILNNSVSLQFTHRVKYFVDSEGTEYVYSAPFVHLSIQLYGRAKNGMDVSRYRSFYFKKPNDIYTAEKLLKICRTLIKELEDLIDAEAGAPYSGPAIFSGEAAAVFFHEIFGHRMEGHRQRDETFGQTFTGKVGQKIFPDFITIKDDPTLKRFQGTLLNGYYPIDDEGVLSEPVTLVDRGVLKTFLMSRKGVQDFKRSNGHGRGVIGREPVSRMGNTIIESSKKQPLKELRAKLISICKERDLPFGYYFKEVQGGFTTTSRMGPQTFKVIPILVYKIHADGSPDTLVNGVDIVGTPLASISKIISTSADYKIFNGQCGAESGRVPVSGIAPDVLFEEFEIEKKQKSFNTDPVLPALEPMDFKKNPLESAMKDEMDRNLKSLKLDDNHPPFFIGYRKVHSKNAFIQTEYGDVIASYDIDNASLHADVKLGDYETSSDYFFKRRTQSHSPSKSTVINDDYYTTRKHLWRLTDSLYKNLVEKFALKKDYLENYPKAKNNPDISKEEKNIHVEKKVDYKFDKKAWEEAISEISRVSLDYKDIDNVSFIFNSTLNDNTYLNSEGTKLVIHPVLKYLSISFEGQRDDLAKTTMTHRIRIPNDAGPLFIKAKLPEIKEKHDLFQKLLHCKPMKDYSGPVIFAAWAFADFVQDEIMPLINGGAKTITADKTKGRNLFLRYRNRQILPSFISVVDDPTVGTFDGLDLIGHYRVDQQGVPAQKVEIMKNGKLLNALYSRRPGKYGSKSTGHGRTYNGMGDVQPVISNLFVESEKTVSKDGLIKMLMEKCRDMDLEYGLIIQSVLRTRKVLEAYRIDSESGARTLVYGGKFINFNIKSFKEIAAVSKERIVREYYSSRSPERSQAMIVPDILIDDVDINKSIGKKPKKPPGEAPLKR